MSIASGAAAGAAVGGPWGAVAGGIWGGLTGKPDPSTGGFGGSRYAGNPENSDPTGGWSHPGGGAGDMGNPAFQWRGDPHGAENDVNRYQGMGAQWANQAAPTTDFSGGDRYMGMGDQARGSQMDALGMQRSAAMGLTPSVAEMQQRQGIDAAMAGQASLAASARGASGLAQAGYNAAGNASQLQSQGAYQGSMLRAGEMANARNAYMQGASGMRGQDYQGAGMMDQRSQYLSDLQMRQRSLGQQGQLAYEGMGYNVNSAQMGASMGLSGQDLAAYNARQQINQASRANDNAAVGNVINGIGTALKATQA